MKKFLFTLGSTLTLALLVSGCGGGARYVETGGRESVVNVGQINIQDFIKAAEESSASLLASGALDKVGSPPAVLAMSQIVNNTGQHVDTDLLTKKIRVKLSQSGKAVTTTTVGLGGKAEDPLAKGLQAERDFLEDKKITRPPDFSLSGKIIETRASAGNVKQATYSFQLSLTDKSGNAVWEDERDITKQGKRATVGF